MAIFDQFPYTNFHELNASWLLAKVKEMGAAVDKLPALVTSEVEKQLEDANLNQIVYNALTTYGLVINVKAPPEGLTAAKGDGVTDDTAAIQACLDYAAANTNKIVFFPAGSYVITDSLTIQGTGCSMLGFNPLNTILSFAGETEECILTKSGITKNQIAGLQIIGSTTAAGDVYAITHTSNRGVDITITDVIIKGVEYGITWSAQNANVNITIDNVIFQNISEAAIQIDRVCRAIISNCQLPSADNNNAIGIEINAPRALITNTIIWGNYGTGIILHNNNCTFTGDLSGATVPYVDNGTGNNIIASNVTSIKTKLNAAEVEAEALKTEDIQYQDPATYNAYFKTVKMKDTGGTEYNVLVEGSDLANLTGGEAVARIDFGSTVIFGDSYTQGYLLDDPETEAFPYKLGALLGCENLQVFGGGGCGFAHVSGSLNVDFVGYFDSIDIENPTGVTAFIIQGGWNDKDQLPSAVQSGMIALVAKIKTACPNAKILFLMNPAFAVLDKNIIRTLTTQAEALGLITLGSSWWWLLGESSLFYSDMVHPKAAGHTRIANAIYMSLMGGVYEHHLLYSVSAETGFTLNFYFDNDIVHLYASGSQPENTHSSLIATVPAALFNGTTAGTFKTPHRLPVAMGNDATDQDGSGFVSFGYSDNSRQVLIRSLRKINDSSSYMSGAFQCNAAENAMFIFG